MRLKKLLYCTLVILLLFSSSALAQDIKMVKMSEDPWPPYTYGEAGKPSTGGIAVEITEEIFKRLNIDVDLMLYNWVDCLNQMRTGERDGLIFLSKNIERQKYMDYTSQVGESRGLIYYLAERKREVGMKPPPEDWKWEDLQPNKVGITAGFNYGEDFFKARDKFHYMIYTFVTDEQNFRELALERTDIFFCTENVANELFKNKPIYKNKFKTLKKPYIHYKFYMSFSKKSPARKLIPKINSVIAEMWKDGTIGRITAKYGL